MGKITYYGRGGVLKIFDGSGSVWAGNTGTPYEITIPFANMDFSGPAARPRPVDPVVVTAGGYVHAPSSDSYEATYYEPLPLSFSCLIDDTTNRQKLRDALCNPDLDDPWLVGTDNWKTTKGRGSVILPDNTFVGTRSLHDSRKVTVELQLVWDSPNATSKFGMAYDELYCPPQNLSIHESPDSVELQVQALVYGNINSISSFKTGKES